MKSLWQRIINWLHNDPYANETEEEWADRQW